MQTKLLLAVLLLFSVSTYAQETGRGKILYTQGHANPACRTVSHQENGTGTIRYFRIANVPGRDDVNAVALAALMGSRDTTVFFENGQTSGCGTEPAIIFITIY